MFVVTNPNLVKTITSHCKGFLLVLTLLLNLGIILSSILEKCITEVINKTSWGELCQAQTS